MTVTEIDGRVSSLDRRTLIATMDPLRWTCRDLYPGVEGCWAAGSLWTETWWCPIVGPSCTLLLRRMQIGEGRQAVMPLGVLGAVVGLGGNGTGRSSSLVRSLARLVRYGLAAVNEAGDGLVVTTRVLPASRRRLREVSPALWAIAASNDAPWRGAGK